MLNEDVLVICMLEGNIFANQTKCLIKNNLLKKTVYDFEETDRVIWMNLKGLIDMYYLLHCNAIDKGGYFILLSSKDFYF